MKHLQQFVTLSPMGARAANTAEVLAEHLVKEQLELVSEGQAHHVVIRHFLLHLPVVVFWDAVLLGPFYHWAILVFFYIRALSEVVFVFCGREV